MRIFILAGALFCCGCAQTSQQETLDALHLDLQTLQSSVVLSNTRITGLQASEAAAETSIDTQLAGLSELISNLHAKVQSTCGRSAPVTNLQCASIASPVILSADNKMLLGEIEYVWLDPPGLSVAARVDTGASYSSLNAENIIRFERDGKNWVRFDIGGAGTPVNIERPIKKFVRVFQQADKRGSRRPVVDMRLSLGDVKDTFSFTLADRSHLEHEIILGRNFLTDIALVDVSQQFVQPAHSTAE